MLITTNLYALKSSPTPLITHRRTSPGSSTARSVKRRTNTCSAVDLNEQPDLAVVLVKPGYPMDDETAEHVATAVAKGMLSTIVFTTDDCFATYEELKKKGIEFTRPAEKHGYGIDASFRDPSGNEFRLLQASPARATKAPVGARS